MLRYAARELILGGLASAAGVRSAITLAWQRDGHDRATDAVIAIEFATGALILPDDYHFPAAPEEHWRHEPPVGVSGWSLAGLTDACRRFYAVSCRAISEQAPPTIEAASLPGVDEASFNGSYYQGIITPALPRVSLSPRRSGGRRAPSTVRARHLVYAQACAPEASAELLRDCDFRRALR